MSIVFTSEAERERVSKNKTSWGLLETTSIVEAVHFAKDNGWKDKKVQVRVEKGAEGETYYVEPYEKGCGCRGILKYRHYFD